MINKNNFPLKLLVTLFFISNISTVSAITVTATWIDASGSWTNDHSGKEIWH